ncbi:MAG: PAS domain S-box protein [Gemmatimonadetes bacterium]|nr:PAS domain S-box protein [Gemmatimonadota bacterium]
MKKKRLARSHRAPRKAKPRAAAPGALSADVLRTVLEHSADVVALVDREGKVLNASVGRGYILGFTAGAMIGRSAFDLVHPEDLARSRQLLTSLLEQPDVGVTADVRTRLIDGSYHTIQLVALNRLEDPKIRAIVIRYRDVSDLQRVEMLFQAVVEASPECVKLVSSGGTVIHMNPAGLAVIDAASLEDVKGTPVIALIAPEHREAFTRFGEEVFRGESRTLRFEVTGLKGKRRWLESYAVAVQGPGVPSPVMLAVTRDITQRKTAEDALKEREGLYRALFENAPIGLGIADETGNLLAFNDAIRAPGGYTAGDIEELGNVARLYCHEDERQEALELAQRNGYLHRHEVRFRRKDGGCYDALMSLTPVEVSGQRCWLAVVEDLTEQRQVEVARHTAEERYRSFIAHSTEAIYRFEVDPPLPVARPEDEQIEHWYRHAYLAECNDAMARMYGYDAAGDLLGTRLGDLLVRTDPTNEEMLRAFIRAGYRLTDTETQDRDREGRPRSFQNSLIGFIEGGQLKRAWGTRRDVTERRDLEAQLRQAQKMEAIGRLAGGVAHDFNNLLTAMLGSVELLLASLSPADPRLEDATDIKSAASRAAALTRQLLAFSRRQLLRPELLDLNRVVRDVQRLLRRLISEDIELVTLLHPDLASVRADRGQIEQALVSLVVNARDAMPQGGTVTLETAHRDLDDAFVRRHPGAMTGPHVLLAVHDTGEGMDPDVQAHIFEPFFTTKELGKGTGLGLATVYGIVKQSGGYIAVDSERGRGTTFRIYLPLVTADAGTPAPAEGAAEAGADAPSSATALRGWSETILVVEDEERIRASARRILEHYGYRVLLAADGQAALELLTAEGAQVDLVLSDVVMPRMNGQQLYDAVRELGKTMKFLFTSGYVGRESRSKLSLEASVPFLPKPWTVQDLITRVRSILDEATPVRT